MSGRDGYGGDEEEVVLREEKQTCRPLHGVLYLYHKTRFHMSYDAIPRDYILLCMI